MTDFLYPQEEIDRQLDELDAAEEADRVAKIMFSENWVVACGGKEPVMTIEGKRYQYHAQQIGGRYTGKRAYYSFEDDMFLTDGLEYLLPQCLKS